MDLSLLARFRMPFALVPLLLRRMIARRPFRLALLPSQTVDFISKALRLCPGIPQVRTQLLHQVQQSLDQFSSVFLMDPIQMNIFKHGSVIYSLTSKPGSVQSFPRFPLLTGHRCHQQRSKVFPFNPLKNIQIHGSSTITTFILSSYPFYKTFLRSIQKAKPDHVNG